MHLKKGKCNWANLTIALIKASRDKELTVNNFQCDPCSPGRMGSSPLTNASEAGSLVLCFDIDCDPGLEVHGEVVG